MKFLRKFFELKKNDENHEEIFNMIRDYFSDITDEQNITEIFSHDDKSVVFHGAINYLVRSKQISRFKTLNMVDLENSHINGAFIVYYENYSYKIILKYLRGSLKFPEFGEDIGIFKSRMEDEGFKVLVLRGSKTSEQDLGKKHAIFKDEGYMSILLFKTEEELKRYQELKK